MSETNDDCPKPAEKLPASGGRSAPPCSVSYPSDWKQIATRIKDASGWICERCKHPHDMSTGHVLTVHHLDGNKANCADWNLAALCQRCHLTVQSRTVMHQLFMPEILDVSEWFKPHLEGYLRIFSPQNADVHAPATRQANEK